MATKTQALGICDFCKGEIPVDMWYTSHGKPRLHCSTTCCATANSRAGAPIRSRKAKIRVKAGQWQNPAKLNPPTPTEQARRARLGRTREVEAGTWRNPALSDAARAKLSRPRKHGDNPVLYRAIRQLSRGGVTADLTPAERDAYRAYRRQLEAARLPDVRVAQRARYHHRQSTMTGDERAVWRARGRRQNHINAAHHSPIGVHLAVLDAVLPEKPVILWRLVNNAIVETSPGVVFAPKREHWVACRDAQGKDCIADSFRTRRAAAVSLAILYFAAALPTGIEDPRALDKYHYEREELAEALAAGDRIGAATEVADCVYYAVKAHYNGLIGGKKRDSLIAEAALAFGCKGKTAYELCLTKYALRARPGNPKDDAAERVAVAVVLSGTT